MLIHDVKTVFQHLYGRGLAVVVDQEHSVRLIGHVEAVNVELLARGESCNLRLDGFLTSASKSCIRRFVITEKAPTRAFSWLKETTTAFTFKTLLRHYAKRALGTQLINAMLKLYSSS